MTTVPALCSLPLSDQGRGLCWREGYLWLNRELRNRALELNPKGNSVWEGVCKANSFRQNKFSGRLLRFSSQRWCLSKASFRQQICRLCFTFSSLTDPTNPYNHSLFHHQAHRQPPNPVPRLPAAAAYFLYHEVWQFSHLSYANPLTPELIYTSLLFLCGQSHFHVSWSGV